jgi:hypothetical protein
MMVSRERVFVSLTVSQGLIKRKFTIPYSQVEGVKIGDEINIKGENDAPPWYVTKIGPKTKGFALSFPKKKAKSK